jgi:hypothetical protein
MPHPIPGLLKSRAVRGAILAVFALEATVVAAVFYSERAHLKHESKIIRSGDASKLDPPWRKVEGPSISRPPTRRAEQAKLPDYEEVIGIVVDGKARAYRVKAFDDPSRHIVNDLIGDRPVTVTYCDQSNCARAYAGPRGGPPLEVLQAGLKGAEMILKVGDTYYWHRTAAPVETGKGPPFPYATYPLVRRTWGDWRREHPDSDLYLGPERRTAP